MTIKVEVYTPTRTVCTTLADEVIVQTLSGKIGILENHTPLVAALRPGLLRIKLNEKWTPIILNGGVAEVYSNRVRILANEVEEFTNMDLRTATQQLEEATLAAENAEVGKERLDALDVLRKANARVEGLNYLS